MPLSTTGPDLPSDVGHRDGAAESHADLVTGVLDALPSPTVLIDVDGTILLANSAWAAAGDLLEDDRLRVGVGGNYFEVMLSLSADPLNHERIGDLRQLSQGRRRQVAADYRLDTVEGARWFHLQASRADQSGRVVVTHTDVTSRVEAEQASAWQARHDHLTDLPNRAHLHHLITTELQRPDRGAVTVLFLDVDGFKDVNDTLGHEVGDHLLRELGHPAVQPHPRRRHRRPARGDEFVVLCRDLRRRRGAGHWPNGSEHTIDEPFRLGPAPPGLTVSIGVATAAGDDRPGRSTDPGPGRRPGHVRGQGRRPEPGAGVSPTCARPWSRRCWSTAELRGPIDAGPARAALPARAAPDHRRGDRGGGAGALAAPGARAAHAVRLHPAGRAERHRRPAHPVGAR